MFSTQVETLRATLSYNLYLLSRQNRFTLMYYFFVFVQGIREEKLIMY